MPKGGRYGGGRSYSSPYSGGSGVYTASGARVYNPAAYAATGAKTYTSTGRPVSNPVAYATASEEAAAAQKAHCYGGNDVAHRLRPGRSPERLAQAQAAPSSPACSQHQPAWVALASHTGLALRRGRRVRAGQRALVGWTRTGATGAVGIYVE